MFWFLRRTGAASFLNSFNGNSTSKDASRNDKTNSDNRNSWLRFRYGRLSVDSDDHNFNKKCDINDDVDDVLVEYKVDTKCCDKINGDESQYLDANGNPVNDPNQDNDCDECECSGVEIDPPIRNTVNDSNENQPNESSVVRNLMSMALSDYDESLTCNVCDRAFHCHRQLASHQQKKRHFGCSACDTTFPSLMLMEHHKEEYEHWSDSDEYQQPCCRRNRRDDYEFSDSDAFTSDAESEDLERLL